MSKSKTTMKDIATACGVSLATVSYVLNNSEKEHISHDTRMKVLEAARLLSYVPCQNRIPIHQKSNLIGIIINGNQSNASSKKMLYYDLAIELHRQLSHLGYDTIVATTKDFEEDADIITKRSLDATFIIDINTANLRNVTRKYYVPIVFLDCEINDPLFCKVYPNYTLIISQAKRILQDDHPFLVMEDILNEEIKNLITCTFDPEDVFMSNSNQELREFLLQRQNRKGIILGEILGLQAERYIRNDHLLVVTVLDHSNLLLPDTKTISVKNKTKAKAAVNILERLLRLEYDICPGNRLLLNPDAPDLYGFH